jgi:hypothetical protein
MRKGGALLHGRPRIPTGQAPQKLMPTLIL